MLAQGYSVGRVEEMPAATHRGSGSGKLLVRQLVRIYTPGTAVEGLLLNDQVGWWLLLEWGSKVVKVWPVTHMLYGCCFSGLKW